MIIVTGAAGFIGSCIVKKLNDQGRKDIICVDRFEEDDKWLNLRGLQYDEYIHADEFIQPEVMESILKMGNLINESVKGKMSKVDRSINRIKEIGGWGTAGAAFVTAVGVLLKAAMGAGLYTLGLPVGLVVMIMLAILVPSAVIGGSATNKRTRDKTGDIRY